MKMYYWHIDYEVEECIGAHHHYDSMTVIASNEQNAFAEMKERIYNEFDYDPEDIGEITIRKGKEY